MHACMLVLQLDFLQLNNEHHDPSHTFISEFFFFFLQDFDKCPKDVI